MGRVIFVGPWGSLALTFWGRVSQKNVNGHIKPSTTWLRENGMPREFIQELHGDRRREAIDIYDHVDKS